MAIKILGRRVVSGVPIRISTAALGLILFGGFALGRSVEVTNSPGSLIRVGPGCVNVGLRVSPRPSQPVEVRTRLVTPAGDDAAPPALQVCDEDGRLTSSVGIGRLGVYRVEATLAGGTDAAACTTVTVAAIPDNKRGRSRPDSPFGMGCYFAMRYSPEELAVAARLAALAGVAWSREEILWQGVEPEKGRFDWDKFDRGVQACLTNDIGVLGLLDYWSKWLPGKGSMTDAAAAEFAAYAGLAATRYRPGGELALKRGWPSDRGVRHWEIWNEPATFWGFTAPDFGKLTGAAARELHRVDRKAAVFFSDGGQSFNEQALAAMGGKPFDGLTPHFYMPPRTPAEGGLAANLKLEKAFYVKRGIDVPLWISEVGWYADDTPEWQQMQANHLVQSYVLSLAAGYDKVFWYNFTNDSPDKKEMQYGLLTRPDFQPRISYGAFAGMVSLLEATRFVESLDIGRGIECHLFRSPTRELVAVLWSEKAGDSLTLSTGLGKPPALFDLYGAEDFSRREDQKRGGSNPGPQDRERHLKMEVPLSPTPVYLKGDKLLGQLLAGAASSADKRLTAQLRQESPTLDAGRHVDVDVVNCRGAKPDVRVALDSEFIDFEPGPPMKIGTATSASQQVKIRKFRRNADNLYPVGLSLDFGSEARSTSVGMLHERVAVRGTPTIDGNLNDWTGAAPIRLDSAAQAVGIVPWMDWNLSATLWLMWDDENLYVAAAVADNEHCQPHKGDLIWEGDSWQVGFDARPGEALGPAGELGPGRYCFGFALGKDGVEKAGWEGGIKPDAMRVAIREHPLTTPVQSAGGPPVASLLVYECALPWGSLAPFQPRAGAQFGFSALLNDNDGGGRRGWMETSPGIGTGFDPRKFERFELR